jgi:type VI secretion system protein ImpA
VGGGGEVRSREDALRLIDRICAYFEQHEPSSPVPLILRRAKRLVGAGFIDILRDMAPAGVGEAETIAGLEAKE